MKLKIVFWVVGLPCSGKSYYAIKIAEKMKTKAIHLDTVINREKVDKLSKEEGYKAILKNIEETAVIDGIAPFTYENEMKMVKSIIKDYKIIYILVEPKYSDYLLWVTKRKIEKPDSSPLTEKGYEEYYQKLKDRIKLFYSLKDDKSLDGLHLGQAIGLKYQHDGFTDVKFKQLKINAKGKSILDLGCNACATEKYFMDDGATRYIGLDVNLSCLLTKNARLFDLNNLEDWKDNFDIVVCTSTLHYIHDKEKLIKESARIANELFVLEAPVAVEGGKKIIYGSRELYFPTKDLLEHWISNHFTRFECLGKSIVEDGSRRFIYHCFK